MYTKRVRVRRGEKTYVYLKLVESYREGGRVRQRVVANLVINSAEAIGNDRDGIITVRTGVERIGNASPGLTGDPGACVYVYIEVTDNGAGMDSETMAKIFDPFFSTKFLGRGLGLAAVEGIVRPHGGRISVNSTPGKGSTFKTLLPTSAPSSV